MLEKDEVDALVIVTGLDGADHPQTSFLFNWLFLGLSGRAVLADRYLDATMTEMVVVIGRKGSSIFVTGDAMGKFSHLVHSIPNCRVFTPTSQ